MADLKRRFQEDLALRDVAKALVVRDVENLKGDLAEQGLGSRFAERMKEGAEGAVQEATEFANENPGRVGSVIGLGLGLLLAWLFREPLARFFDEAIKALEFEDTPPASETEEAIQSAEDAFPPDIPSAPKVSVGDTHE